MPRGRPRAFDRDKAIQAAMVLFWEKGYYDTSIADLKEAMGGISSASFYAAFASKEALFEEVVAVYCATCGEVVSFFNAPNQTAIQRLQAGLERSAMMQTNAAEHPLGCLTVLCIPTSGTAYQSVFLTLAKVRAQVNAAIRSCIESGIAHGELRAGLSPVGTSVLVASFLQGLSIQARDGCTLADLREAIRTLLQGLT